MNIAFPIALISHCYPKNAHSIVYFNLPVFLHFLWMLWQRISNFSNWYPNCRVLPFSEKISFRAALIMQSVILSFAILNVQTFAMENVNIWRCLLSYTSKWRNIPKRRAKNTRLEDTAMCEPCKITKTAKRSAYWRHCERSTIRSDTQKIVRRRVG